MPGKLVQRVWESNPAIYAPARHKRACRYQAFLPEMLAGLNVHLPLEIAGLAAEAEAEVRGLNAVAAPALAPLARLLLRTESIASSRVEGLRMGVRDLARAEARIEMGGKRSGTAVEIIANIEAMQVAIDAASNASCFGEEQLLAIHQRLMEHDPRPKIAGRIRTGQNWIGGNNYTPCGADFVPPPAEEVPRLLADLYATLNDDLLPAVVQAALVHAQFETIHPFDDGNGRTGRALIHVILRRRGVALNYVPPISVVLASSRERYITGLTGFRGDDVAQWIEHFSAAVAHSAVLASRYLQHVDALMTRWREQLSSAASPRADATAWAIINALPAHPMLTGATAAAATGRSRGPVYLAIAELEAAGVLIPVSTSRGRQTWEAAGLLPLLEAFEEGRLVDV